jgi:hypothetical protein
MGDRGDLYLSGRLFDPCTSTTTTTTEQPTSRPASTTVPVLPTSIVSTSPPPLHTEAKMMLWEDLPTRDDMAKMPPDYRSVDSWKEISAVTNAINNIAPW